MTTITVHQDVDLVSAIEKAQQISVLTDWIERARSLCDQLALQAKLNPQLATALSEADIRIHKAAWQEEQSMALELIAGIRCDALSEASFAAKDPHIAAAKK